jgi:hypothetical protein
MSPQICFILNIQLSEGILGHRLVKLTSFVRKYYSTPHINIKMSKHKNDTKLLNDHRSIR